ncbi:MAG: MBL fold metallo-hydrolase [Pseudomonadota bacterium]
MKGYAMKGYAMWKKPEHHFVIKEFHPPGSEKNEYLLINQEEAAVIDVSTAGDQVEAILRESKLTLKYLLVTHAHPSHLLALPGLKAGFGGAFCLHMEDCELLKASNVRIEPDLYIEDKTHLELGDGQIKVLHTPGHTEGSVCFYVKELDALFSGRTLEKNGYGTIWGPTSMSRMLSSLKRLNSTIYSATVYPGRGERTTMPKEAWLNCLRSH